MDLRDGSTSQGSTEIAGHHQNPEERHGMGSAQNLPMETVLLLTLGFQSSERIHFSCFKPPSLRYFVPAVLGNQYTYLMDAEGRQDLICPCRCRPCRGMAVRLRASWTWARELGFISHILPSRPCIWCLQDRVGPCKGSGGCEPDSLGGAGVVASWHSAGSVPCVAVLAVPAAGFVLDVAAEEPSPKRLRLQSCQPGSAGLPAILSS